MPVHWLSDLFANFERHPARTFVAVGLLFILAYMAAHVWFPKPPGRVIDGDALGYYAWLRSVAFDGDIDFSNDYRLLDAGFAEDSPELTPLATGLVPNKWPPGSAILWAPLFLAIGAVVALLNLLGAQIPFDGLSLPFKISAGVAGIAYAAAGAWLCYDLARRVYPAASAFWATITLWLGGSLLYYSLVSPTYSHATSLFAVALFTHTWYRTRDRGNLRRFALLGGLAGLAGLVRSQDLIILIIPGLELLHGIRERRWSLALASARLLVLCVACAATFAPQLWVWQTIYGTLLLNPHTPGGSSGYFLWTQPAILETLFSTRQGLIAWSPIVLFAAVGIAWLFRHDRLLAWATAVTLLIALYVNAAAIPWWAGASFGGRRFISYLPFLVLGLTAFLASPAMAFRPALVRLASVILIGSNVLFLLQYQLFMRGFTDIVGEYPDGLWAVFVERFVVPFRLVAAWMTS